jgi:ketosteroid isomerase-like protein
MLRETDRCAVPPSEKTHALAERAAGGLASSHSFASEGARFPSGRERTPHREVEVCGDDADAHACSDRIYSDRIYREEGGMSLEGRLLLLEQAIKGLSARDWDAYGQMFAEDVAVYSPGSKEPSLGRAARVQWVVDLIRAFPDAIIELKGTFGQGDHLCAEFAFAGTHTGPLNTPGGEVAPTNARVEFPYCIAYDYKGNMATEVREYFDQLELLMPLGLLQPASS